MTFQVDQDAFAKALSELGHNPQDYQGKKISIDQFEHIYQISREYILEAIETKVLAAHYDFRTDIIWIDALEAAYFFYCLKSEAEVLADSPVYDLAG